MRVLILLLFAVCPLYFCSCDSSHPCIDEEERERESREDKENHECRSCQPITISVDDNCPLGYECDPDWQLKTNFLSPHDCSCSEVQCADRNSTLAVDGQAVGRILCRNQQWTLARDSSINTDSAVCARSCGVGVCKSSHPSVSKDDYTQLDVKKPSDDVNCANSECTNGVAVFNDDGSFKNILTETSLACLSSGKWKVGEGEERYVMCLKACECSVTDSKLTDGSFGACPPDTLCVPPSGDSCTSVKCPDNSSPKYLDAADRRQSSVEIKCVGRDWIAAGSKDVTCAYDAGAGQSSDPPANCPKLQDLDTCYRGVCNYNQLIYTPYKSGSRVLCKEGALQVGAPPEFGYSPVADCVDGTWKVGPHTITKATCVTGGSPAQKCIDKVSGGAVKYSCKLGACTLTCQEADHKFEYTLDGKTIKHEHVKCSKFHDLVAFDGSPIENVKCV